MFDFKKNDVIKKVANPLKATKNSVLEFKAGNLRDAGLFRLKKMIEFDIEGKTLVRYLLYSNVDDTECVFDVYPTNNNRIETYVYTLEDTIPFSEEFLNDVAGQLYLTTPSGDEFIRCIMKNEDDRIEGVRAKARIYDVETEEIERVLRMKIWEYERDAEGITEYLTLEMDSDNGLFKIFRGEVIEDIFYNFYQTSNN